ncbi:hypothetical protein NW759_007040 [Fusarium solani]|nr:hypothetical protein NW759_007040 [Fusarium solani]
MTSNIPALTIQSIIFIYREKDLQQTKHDFEQNGETKSQDHKTRQCRHFCQFLTRNDSLLPKALSILQHLTIYSIWGVIFLFLAPNQFAWFATRRKAHVGHLVQQPTTLLPRG